MVTKLDYEECIALYLVNDAVFAVEGGTRIPTGRALGVPVSSALRMERVEFFSIFSRMRALMRLTILPSVRCQKR